MVEEEEEGGGGGKTHTERSTDLDTNQDIATKSMK